MEIRVTKEFLEAFDKCIKHWNVTGEELEFERQRVRANYAEAERCYLAIAGCIGGSGSGS